MGRDSNTRVTNSELMVEIKHLAHRHEELHQTVNANLLSFQEHIKDDLAYQSQMTIILLGDPNDIKKEGIIPQLRTVQKDRENRKKHFWVLYTTLVAILLTRAFDWLKMIASAMGHVVPKP